MTEHRLHMIVIIPIVMAATIILFAQLHFRDAASLDMASVPFHANPPQTYAENDLSGCTTTYFRHSIPKNSPFVTSEKSEVHPGKAVFIQLTSLDIEDSPEIRLEAYSSRNCFNLVVPHVKQETITGVSQTAAPSNRCSRVETVALNVQ